MKKFLVGLVLVTFLVLLLIPGNVKGAVCQYGACEQPVEEGCLCGRQLCQGEVGMKYFCAEKYSVCAKSASESGAQKACLEFNNTRPCTQAELNCETVAAGGCGDVAQRWFVGEGAHWCSALFNNYGPSTEDKKQCIKDCTAVSKGEEVPMPGEQEVAECCQVKHNLKNFSGDFPPGPREGDIVAQPEGYCELTGNLYPTRKWAAYCTIDTVYRITDWLFWLILTVSTIVIIYGAILFFGAAARPEAVSKAKKAIMFGVIGLLVGLLAKFIPAIARFFLGL